MNKCQWCGREYDHYSMNCRTPYCSERCQEEARIARERRMREFSSSSSSSSSGKLGCIGWVILI